MTTLILITPYVAFGIGAAMTAWALHLYWESRPLKVAGKWRKIGLLLWGAFLAPSLAHAQVDLQTSVESGNAIIMYLCGIFAAVGIVTAGVSMMAGRPTIAKWSFAGAMVSGLGFAIVKTMLTNFGLTPADVGAFAP